MWLNSRIKQWDFWLFIFPIMVFFINNRIKYNIEIPILDVIMQNHFNDFLGGISIMAYINLILSLKKDKPLRIEKFWILTLSIILIGIFWEVISPLYLSNSTGDPLDIFAYFLGGCAYFGLDKYFARKIN